MGLAASQARFLAITARKADCENRSMSIAQEKLSITNQLAKISHNYKVALDATKLVWDGETEDGTIYDLSYDVMMKPSDLNGYSPYLVTTRTGQIVCNEQVAKACEAAGLNEVATKGSLHGRNAFVQALADVGYISGITAQTIIGDSDTGTIEWSSQAGFGGNLLDKSTASAMTIGTMLNYIENVLDPEYREQFPVGSPQRKNNDALVDAISFKDQSGIYIGGSSSSEYNVADLLTKEVALVLDAKTQNWLVDCDIFKSSLKAVLKSKTLKLESNHPAVQSLLDAFENISGAFKALLVNDKETQDTQAFEFAQRQTLQQVLTALSDIGGSQSDLISNSKSYNGVVFGNNSKGVMNLSNLTEMFLTNYAIALDGYDSGYYIGKTTSSSNYVTNDYNYVYVLKNHSSLYDEKDLMVADFINVLYNNICAYGWTRSTGNIDDNEFLQNSLKNGRYFISSLNSDLYYYQDHYTRNGCVGEVTDEDAITRAEAEYTAQKSKLNYKEETLDIELQQLDLEISSLTTEYDTVKSMISKNVEKIFTMFSS